MLVSLPEYSLLIMYVHRIRKDQNLFVFVLHIALEKCFVDKVQEAMDVGEEPDEWEELESWEPVSAEKEEWIGLIHRLEGLSLLSNAVGQENMRKLPPAPWTDAQQHQLEESEEVKEDDNPSNVLVKKRLNVANLQVMLLSGGKHVQSSCTHARRGRIDIVLM